MNTPHANLPEQSRTDRFTGDNSKWLTGSSEGHQPTPHNRTRMTELLMATGRHIGCT